MRVVSGHLRGRRIEAPPGNLTRPTTDKVREAVFGALGSLDLVADARVVDLYAGSGALGIEALSRGAAHCTFVERDRAALAVLRDNLAALDLLGRSRVLAGDALAHAANLDADLVFADPPYAPGARGRPGRNGDGRGGEGRDDDGRDDDGRDDDGWRALLDRVRAPFVVAEAGHPIGGVEGWVEGWAGGWEVVREKRYGRTWVTFLQRR